MHILVISDIHGDTAYLQALDSEFKKADLVLFAGDFATENEPEKGFKILDMMLEKQDNLLSVIGNCDVPSFLEEIEKRDVCVQKEMIFRDGLVFAGAGGALKFTGATPNERTEEDLLSDLECVRNRFEEYDDNEWQNLILVVHQPPHNTKLDVISAGIHVGSPAYRTFIEKIQPLVAISGHIHESKAVDVIGKTTLINPGSLAEGNYALLEVQKKEGEWKVVKAELKEIKVS